MNEREDIFKNPDIQATINKYNDMLKKRTKYFFDVHEFENMIDFYASDFNFNKASEIIDFATQLHPTSTAIKFKKAQILIDKGQTNRGIELIEEIEDIEKWNNELYILKGNAFAIEGDLSLATEYYNKAISITIEDVEETMYNISVSLVHLCHFEHAILYLNRAIDFDPDNTTYIYDLAYCYEQMEDYDSCVKIYERYLDLDPFSEHVWHNLGMVYAKLEKLDNAAECFEYAIAINDSYATAHFNLANIYSNQNKYKKAIEQYKEFNKLEDNNSFAHFYLGECYEYSENPKEAIKHYLKAIEIEPNFSEAWFACANLYRELNNTKKAIEYYKIALQLENENTDFLYNYAEINKEIRKFNEAKESLHKLLKEDPKDDDAWILYSEIFYEEGNLENASSILVDALSENQNNFKIYFRLAVYYYILNRKQQFLHMFEKGLQINYDGHQLFFDFFPTKISNRHIKRLLKKYNK